MFKQWFADSQLIMPLTILTSHQSLEGDDYLCFRESCGESASGEMKGGLEGKELGSQ